jgi:teichuronic acid biosynthesis glycosyltransferase TuaC
MRILAVTNIYPLPRAPGFPSYVEQQIKGLRQIGLDVSVMHVNRHEEGMKVYLGLPRQLKAEINRFQPDIVHAMYGGIIAERVTRIVKDRPTIITFHGSDLLGQHLDGSLRRVIAAYGVFASKRSARRADGIVAVSRVLQNALPREIVQTKVRIIPCGIDLERFKPLDRDECRRQLGWNTDCFHVLFPSGPGNSVKRFPLASAAVDLLMRSGVRSELHCLNGVANEQVGVWLNSSDVLLLTSLHEGSPTIVKEALACNIPVVSVDVGDLREQVQNIDGCHLASPTPSDLAAKLCLVSLGERRLQSRERVHHLSLECIARQLKAFYEEVLQQGVWQTKLN